MPRIKGGAKPEGSGRTAGTRNKVTRIMERSDPQKVILKMLEDEACNNKSINAARIWLEHNRKITGVVNNNLETLGDVDLTSKEVHQQMLCGEIAIPVGERLLNTLSLRQKHIEAKLDPVLQELIDERLTQIKMKKE